ncbi:aromatic amino acid ammonia-lyase [Streptomyces sp. JB150]|uniref:aromatic amino acid ammonia-lyase n=1 Tax=Streptomyces sp. JB150 TaxID=2714844 RepID=UPI0014088603|nr:aromatic amino acid ammonia-lyase [Streptomyces sp. JB150]QIJ65338.1 aromatic amino acid lyase [Streptomyces sp. JB150]
MSTTTDDPPLRPDPAEPPARAGVVLDGAGLTVEDVVRLADGAAVPDVPATALERVRRSWRAAQRLAAAGRLYGRATGVGAHRSVPVGPDDEADHGLRLLRSHAGGAGALLPARQVRAMLAVRANQLLAGGSGIHPDIVHALVEALRLGRVPAVPEYGGLGTGDLTALAATGLTLLGERPWLPAPTPHFPTPRTPPTPDRVPVPVPGGDPSPAFAPAPVPEPRRDSGLTPAPGTAPATAPAPTPTPVPLRPGDALALLSSNALVLGQAALASHALGVLLRATHAVAALSLAAVSGSPETYAAPVHALRPYPGAAHAAAEVRRLLGLPKRPAGSGRRIQDPYGFRAFPQVHGPTLDAADALRRIVETEINCPTENPLIAPDGTAAYHHGGFYAAPLALALDALNLALLQTAQLSAARLTALGRPDLTGLPAFLATGPAGSSGTMILEYTAGSALAELRASATPASAGHAVLSHGLEEAASFASQAARQTLRAVDAYRTVLACELVTAVRALRLHPSPPRLPVLAVAAAALPAGTEDRPLTPDLERAQELLTTLAEL